MKLTKQNIAEMATLLYDGATSAQIAEKFGISVPTVQYHRAKLKKNGLFAKKSKDQAKLAAKAEAKAVPASELQVPAPSQKISAKATDLQIKVNGMMVRIDKAAKQVFIQKDHIEIQF
jgi:transposase